MKISAVNPDESFSGMTVPVEIPKDSRKFDKLIQLSRDHYTTLYVKPKVETVTVTYEKKEEKNKTKPVTKTVKYITNPGQK